MELIGTPCGLVPTNTEAPKNQMNSSYVSGSKNASFVAVMMVVVRKSNGRKWRSKGTEHTSSVQQAQLVASESLVGAENNSPQNLLSSLKVHFTGLA